MKKHFITLLFLVLAMAFYALGAAGPGTVFLLLGMLAEGVFWLRLLRSGRTRRHDAAGGAE